MLVSNYYSLLLYYLQLSLYIQSIINRERAYSTPPTTLIQAYFKCRYKTFDILITAFGSGSATASGVIPVVVIIFIIFISSSKLPRKLLIRDQYDEGEVNEIYTIISIYTVAI